VRVQKGETRKRFGDDELVGMGSWFVAEDYRYELDGRIHPFGRASGFKSPLEDTDLFLSFARLGAGDGPDMKKILEWVRKYGLLRREIEKSPYRHLEDGRVNQAPIRVDEFRSEVDHAYRALTLFEQIRAKDYEKLRERISREVDWIERPVTVDGVQGTEVLWKMLPEARVALDGAPVQRVVPGLRTSGVMMAPLDGEIPDVLVIEQAVEGLQRIVEEKMSRVRVRFTQHVHNPRPLSMIAGSLPFRPLLTWRCPDLLSALWFQFAALMTDKRPLRTCEGCGQLFLQTRPDKESCDSTCRQKKSRKKRREQSESGQ
jgi:hypothetical protein